MVRRKAYVRSGMPVAGGDFEGKGEGEEGVDEGGDGAAAGDGEGAVLRAVSGKLSRSMDVLLLRIWDGDVGVRYRNEVMRMKVWE